MSFTLKGDPCHIEATAIPEKKAHNYFTAKDHSRVNLLFNQPALSS